MLYTSNLIRGVTRLAAISLITTLLCAELIPLFSVAAAPLGATSPTLGAAASYSVLGGQAVTNTGPTTMPGDLGVSPGSAVSGFPPGSIGPPGTIHAADAQAAAAQVANAAAFTFLDQGCDTTYPNTKDLVGESLMPGVYCAGAFRLSGTLTFTGTGVWIFKSAADLITSGSANIVGGNPCSVWWRAVSSATLGTNTSLIGTILASTSISLQTGARLNGRAFAQTGAVTLDTNTFTGPSCAVVNTPLPTASNTPLPAATDTPIPAPTNTRERPSQKTEVPAAPDTPVPVPTDTPVPVESVTPLATFTATPVPPIPARLPKTGGDPPRHEDLLLTVVLAAWVVGAVALGIRRREEPAKVLDRR